MEREAEKRERQKQSGDAFHFAYGSFSSILLFPREVGRASRSMPGSIFGSGPAGGRGSCCRGFGGRGRKRNRDAPSAHDSSAPGAAARRIERKLQIDVFVETQLVRLFAVFVGGDGELVFESVALDFGGVGVAFQQPAVEAHLGVVRRHRDPAA